MLSVHVDTLRFSCQSIVEIDTTRLSSYQDDQQEQHKQHKLM